MLMRGVVAYHRPLLPAGARVAKRDGGAGGQPAAAGIIERMALWPWDKPEAEQTCTGIIEEELAQAPRESWQLPLPSDGRLTGWLQEIKRGDTLPDRLNRLAERVGASDKTIGRIFMRETGMSYQAWRQQWRLLRAMELLAEAEPISRVALRWSSPATAPSSPSSGSTGQTPCATSTLGMSRIGRARLHHQGLQGQRLEVVDGLCHHVMGSLLLQGQHLLLQGGAVQLGSRVLGGHGIQAQAAGNQG